MVRRLQEADINRVIEIWLDTNLKAHYFIPVEYWKNNLDFVKEMLPQAEVYVYTKKTHVQYIFIKEKGLKSRAKVWMHPPVRKIM